MQASVGQPGAVTPRISNYHAALTRRVQGRWTVCMRSPRQAGVTRSRPRDAEAHPFAGSAPAPLSLAVCFDVISLAL